MNLQSETGEYKKTNTNNNPNKNQVMNSLDLLDLIKTKANVL